MMAKPIILLAGLLGTLTIFIPTLARACAVCFGGPDEKWLDGYFASTLFLMAMPYTLVGTIGGWLFLRYRAAQGRPV